MYAAGDLVGPPMEMFKARKCGVGAARNIMGEDYEFDFTEYPDFLHTTYEVTWCGLSEAEAKARYRNIIKIQMPPDDADPETFALPAAEGSMLYAFTRPILSGWLKLVIDADSRKVLGAHHVGFGAKDAFQYIDYLIRRPEGFTMDEMAELNELFLNPEHFIQLCRLRAGQQQPGEPVTPQPPDHPRVAVVTGGASGIGLATCGRLRDEGFTVAALDMKPDGAAGAAAMTLGCDVTDEADVGRAMGEVAARLGPIDVLVNNAGITAPRPRPGATRPRWRSGTGSRRSTCAARSCAAARCCRP